MTRQPRKTEFVVVSADDPDHRLGVDQYIYSNLVLYRDRITPGVAALVAAGKASCGSAELLTPVPALFRPIVHGQKPIIADMPGAANLVSLYENVIVPEQDFAPFNRRILSALEGRGLRVQFVDDSAQHFRQGEVHCGTLVVRDPKATVAF